VAVSTPRGATLTPHNRMCRAQFPIRLPAHREVEPPYSQQSAISGVLLYRDYTDLTEQLLLESVSRHILLNGICDGIDTIQTARTSRTQRRARWSGRQQNLSRT
jgi:hypothetical protein